MKNKFRLLRSITIIALIAVISFGTPSCGGDSGDDGTGGGNGGGGFSASRLIGLWQRDDGMYLRFDKIQSGMAINVYMGANAENLSGGTHGLEGNFMDSYTHSFKVAFEGEQLRVSEFTLLNGVTELMIRGPDGNWITDLNGLYTKVD